MAKYLESDCKRCRRYGVKLNLKGERCYTGKCAFEKRKTPPGMHTKAGKLSDYGLQLREKQKLRYIYGVLERQFRRYFENAAKKKGMTGFNLLLTLEFRLDNIIYLAGFMPSRKSARQIVLHNKVLVNGKKVNVSNYICKVNDVISINEKFKENKVLKEAVELAKQRGHKNWLDVNYENLSIKILREPTREEIDVPVNEQLIVELYSK